VALFVLTFVSQWVLAVLTAIVRATSSPVRTTWERGDRPDSLGEPNAGLRRQCLAAGIFALSVLLVLAVARSRLASRSSAGRISSA